MDPITGGLIAGGANLLSSIFGTTQNNAMQKELMQQQEAYNTQMSNTAYQRASADMKAAGLNPMMMFGSGGAASSPTAPTPQLQSPLQGAGSAVDKGISTALGMRTANATVDNLIQENANLKTREGLMRSEQMATNALTDMRAVQTDESRANINLKNAAMHEAINDALRADNEAALRGTPAGRLLDQAGLAGRKVSDVFSPIGSLVSTARQGLRMYNPLGGY